MKSYLKVKSKSLAAEARIIRTQEQKWRDKARAARAKGKNTAFYEANMFGLKDHRRIQVRREARSTHIAYGFLLGRSYRQMEKVSYTQPDWERIETMVKKYGPGDQRDIMQKYAEWKAEALGDDGKSGIAVGTTPRSYREQTPWYQKAFDAVKAAVTA